MGLQDFPPLVSSRSTKSRTINLDFYFAIQNIVENNIIRGEIAHSKTRDHTSM
jgi:hypothetical protein